GRGAADGGVSRQGLAPLTSTKCSGGPGASPSRWERRVQTREELLSCPWTITPLRRPCPSAATRSPSATSSDKKLAWLELTNFESLLANSGSHKIAPVLIGAMPVVTRKGVPPPG